MTEPARTVAVNTLSVSNTNPFTLIAGPCVMEGREHALMMADSLRAITEKLGIGLIYKSSFDKANRSSMDSPRGVGLDEAMRIFQEVKDATGLPVLTDVHERAHCAATKDVMDVIQIPAFLCRQTDLLVAAGQSGCVVNVKKGQFLAPWDMTHVVKKITATGNHKVMVCERGVSFGYNTLVSDMRALVQLAADGYPVVYDATHSVQQPGGLGGRSGGQREYAPVLARAALAVGVAAVFMEVHDDPDHAPSDGPNMVRLEKLAAILAVMTELDKIAKAHPVDLDALS